MHQNINGLIGKSDQLVVILENLKADDKYIDILCITEHNMVKDDESRLAIPNFKLASSFSKDTRHGGSCILLRSHHDFESAQDIVDLSIPGIIECSAIKLTPQKMYVICAYRPPRVKAQIIEMFLDRLDQILLKLCGKGNNYKIIICGDFNIDILRTKSCSTKFKYLVLAFNLKFQFYQVTRLSSGTCIDNIIHNVRGVTGDVSDFAISDHAAQIVKVPVKKYCKLKYWFVNVRDYSIENIQKFKQSISALSFENAFQCNDPNIAFELFYELFILFYDLCFPTHKLRVSADKKPKWISKGIQKCSKIKRTLLWQYRRSKNDVCKNKYKSYAQRYKKIIRLTKKLKMITTLNNLTIKLKLLGILLIT